jgi:uncharacterized protein (DUF983 family)
LIRIAVVTEPSSSSPVGLAIAGKCPCCGGGKLFRNGLELRDVCSNCGLDYKFFNTGDGPAVFAILILGVLILGGALYVEFSFLPPLWVHAVLWGVLTPLVALGLLRVLKGWLIGQQFKHKAEEGRLGAQSGSSSKGE